MVLFPIAFLWLLVVMIWLIRNSLNTGPEQEPGEPRRWFPLRPRRPSDVGPQRANRGNRFARARANSRS
jgi:hypothetical protein